jgi:hypothetical protein
MSDGDDPAGNDTDAQQAAQAAEAIEDIGVERLADLHH